MKVIDLPPSFVGTGEVKGSTFTRVFDGHKRKIYEVLAPEAQLPHYEVFDVKTTAICLDFANRIYSEDEVKVVYPKSADFGSWAWTYNNLESALKKAEEL
jgi:hypothetical protein